MFQFKITPLHTSYSGFDYFFVHYEKMDNIQDDNISTETKSTEALDNNPGGKEGEEFEKQVYIERDSWSAPELVRLIQGGLLCKGIYLSDQIDELEKEREPVVDVSDDLEFKGAQSNQEIIHREFHSKNKMELFDETIDKSERSVSGSVGVMVWGVDLGSQSSFTRKTKQENKEEQTEKKFENYISNSHYQFIPVKAIHLTKNVIDLKPEVIKAIQNVEKRIKMMRYESRDHFHEFFKTYGSHIHYGVIELGGIRSSKAWSEGFEDSNLSKMTELTHTVSKASLNLGFTQPGSTIQAGIPIKASDVLSETTSNFTEEELKRVDVTLRKMGGPEEIDDIEEWRKVLVANSSLWRIINRTSKPKPIWEFLDKYEDKFHNCFLLGNAMEEAWDKLSNTKATDQSFDALRKDIRIWMELNRDALDMTERIGELSRMRLEHDIKEEDWRDEVVYLPEVQEFILKAVEQIQCTDDYKKISQMNLHMENILRPTGQLEEKKFPSFQEISQKLRDAERRTEPNYFTSGKIDDLGKTLRDRLEKIDRVDDDRDLELRKLQQRLEEALKIWSIQLKSYEYLICIGIVGSVGFNFHQFKFSEYNLLQDDLNKISVSLNRNLDDFRSLNDVIQKQAFVLNLCLECPEQKEAINFMTDNMPDDLHAFLQTAYEDAQGTDGTLDSTKFQSSISQHLDKETSMERLNALARSLKTQLTFEQPPRTEQKEHSDHQNKKCYKSVEKLLEILNMSGYYPQKLSYEDAIRLTEDMLCGTDKKPTSPAELLWYFMRRIISLDSSVRENCFLEKKDNFTDSLKDDDSSSSSGDNSDDDDEGIISNEDSVNEDLLEETEDELDTGNNDEDIHPLDLIYAIFLCADDFLRQELLDKMSRCQYAVPFIMPSPCSSLEDNKSSILHWGLRSIRRSYHHKEVENKALTDLQAPLVACVSVGEEISWKSKLLNKMLSPQQETFWHQGLKGGDYKQKISQGMVEVAWYLPGDHEDNTFPRPFTFVNLRGKVEFEFSETTEAESIETPESKSLVGTTESLLTTSSVVCVFVNNITNEIISFLNKAKKAHERMILVVLHKKGTGKQIARRCEKIQKKLKLGKHQIISKSAEDANFDKVYNQLRSAIDHVLAKKNKLISISEFVEEARLTGHFEFDDERCACGRKAAEAIFKDIDEVNSRKQGSAKAEILPCQSEIALRQEIASLDKELCRQRKRKEDTTVESHVTDIRREKLSLQLKQLQKPISPTFRYFLKSLTSLNSMDRKYFLQNLKLGLNERSVQYLEPLYQEYAKCRLEADSGDKDRHLQKIEEDINHGSLGLEHFFREMAVVYHNIRTLEIQLQSKELSGSRSNLAQVMANLFMDGTAIEIMDGDAITVPVVWLKAVMKRIPEKITARLFQVAVLGAQSCGKSTLLNTVFGLNFPVSSGRCTRGAYMQLVKVEKEFTKTLGCEYVLVIDSEGLMSRAMSSRSDYDNELSTFIIGLSDLTLVIIKGEGNEMQDVLPLAIHVFLRMNIVGEHQACHFVHQNMEAVDAMSKGASEIDAFVRDLNFKTLAAATDAGESGKYTKFSDVLHYDPTTDNTYVPGLWDGTPPMGSTNVHYSAKMVTLKSRILKNIQQMKTNNKMPSTIEDFRVRLKELWDAIKYENFVFTFKNVLAYEAHKKLTDKFDRYQWDVKCAVREMIEDEEISSKNLLGLEQCDANLEDLMSQSLNKITVQLSEKGAEIKEKISHYFRCPSGCNDSNKNIQNRHLLSKYEKDFDDDIDFLQKSLTREVDTTFEKLELRINASKQIRQDG